jgi:adenylyltransferase/sulfurtransferase
MNDELLLRYSRQILLPDVDIQGQATINQARVLVLGAGGLGAPVLLYLAAAGVGHITVVDPDTVDLSNLQRQIIHSTVDIKQAKVESAKQSMLALNPHIQVQVLPTRLEADQILTQVATHDVVVDCTDNFPTRFAINQACFSAKKPLVSGAVIRLEGQITTFDFRQAGACYRCLYNEEGGVEDTCSTNGILAPIAGIIGSMQATEALKVLLNLPTLHGRLLVLDAKYMQWRELRLRVDANCPVCGIA